MLTGEDSIGVQKARAGITRPFHQCWKGLPQSSTHSDNKDPGKKEAKTKRNIPQHNKTVRKSLESAPVSIIRPYTTSLESASH